MPAAARTLSAPASQLDKRPVRSRHLRVVGEDSGLQAAHRATPFLKWVGGKGKLLPDLRKLLPAGPLRYAEPFVGGGALFFDLHSEGHLESALLCDAGTDLMGAYRTVKNHLPELLALLQAHEDTYLSANEEGRALYFYHVRNRHPADFAMSEVERAARMLFLNRTCFNGLWRENRTGRFNAPHGRYPNPGIVQADKLHAASRALQQATLIQSDFRHLPEHVANAGVNFVYLDPPYHPLSQTSSFNAYSGGTFSGRAQAELADVCRRLDAQGVKFLLSNSDCTFVRDLYRGFDIGTIRAARSVNCKAEGRGAIDEVVIRNY